jgi:hypothetical protein
VEQQAALQNSLKSKHTNNEDMGYNTNLTGFLQYANMFNGASVPTTSTSSLNYDDSKLKETNQNLTHNGHNHNNWFINALTQYSMAAAVSSSVETSSTSPSSSSSSSNMSTKHNHSSKYLEKNSAPSSSISCSTEPNY